MLRSHQARWRRRRQEAQALSAAAVASWITSMLRNVYRSLGPVAIGVCFLHCGRLGFDPVETGPFEAGPADAALPQGDGSMPDGTVDAPVVDPGEACTYLNPLPCGLPGIALITSGSQSVSDNTNVRGDQLLGSCARAPGSGEFTVTYTSSVSGTYVFFTAGSAIDTTLYIRDGGCGGPELACNDDVTPGDRTSQVVISVVPDQVIVAVVDGATGLCGEITLTVARL